MRRKASLSPVTAAAMRIMVAAAVVVAVGCSTAAGAENRPAVRMLLGGEYWSMEPVQNREAYLNYLTRVKPDVIHAGVLGTQLASTIHTQGKFRAYSSIHPTDVTTIEAYLDWWRPYLDQIHDRGVKVQAIFSMTYAWGDHRQNTGFFKYYNDLWEDRLLGPKPHPHAAGLMQLTDRGQLVRDQVGYKGCVNNVYWRQSLKALLRVGIQAGFDGAMVQFPYSDGPCSSAFCQQKFRAFLAGRYAPHVLAQKFGIHDLDRYVFDRHGMPDQMALEARQFAAVSVKACFDDVFVGYGRSLNPDLIVSMWTHFRNFLVPTIGNTDFGRITDERALLPIHLWGKGENYTWHCSPMRPDGEFRLGNGFTGDQTLEYKFARAMAADVPALIQKYDPVRWRVNAAEALALGGVVFGV